MIGYINIRKPNVSVNCVEYCSDYTHIVEVIALFDIILFSLCSVLVQTAICKGVNKRATSYTTKKHIFYLETPHLICLTSYKATPLRRDMLDAQQISVTAYRYQSTCIGRQNDKTFVNDNTTEWLYDNIVALIPLKTFIMFTIRRPLLGNYMQFKSRVYKQRNKSGKLFGNRWIV